jgi:hypothetical protein
MCVKLYFYSHNRLCGLVFSAAHVQFTLIFTSAEFFLRSFLSPVRNSFLTCLPIADYTKLEEAVHASRIQVHEVSERPAWTERRVDSLVPGAQWAVRRCYWTAATLLFKVVYVGSVSTRKVWMFGNSLHFGFPRSKNSPRGIGSLKCKLCARLHVKQDSTVYFI